MLSLIRMMTSEEQAETVVELYSMNIIGRKRARELLGIDEGAYLERVVFGRLFSALDERFDSLPDRFLSSKHMEQIKEYGD